MSDKKRLNVLMLVLWYGAKDGRYTGGPFHYELAKSLNQYCNRALYYPYNRSLTEAFSGGVESIANKDNGILVEKGNMEEIYRGMVERYHSYGNYNSKKYRRRHVKNFPLTA